MKLPISANLVVYNEAHRIIETLQQLRPHVDEIVLVDQSSTDGTGSIAWGTRCVDVVILDEHHGRCEPSRGLAAAKSKYDWLLILDADERVTEEAWGRIEAIIDYDEADAVYFTISNYVGGRHIQDDLMACPRLVKRSHVNFVSHLHGTISPWPSARTLAIDDRIGILHEKSVEEQQADWDRYSKAEGRDRGTWTNESRYD